MSREEAAVHYLDVALGFRRDFRMFLKAAATLNEDDKSLLQQAASRRFMTDERQESGK